jgi:hypothetical protein
MGSESLVFSAIICTPKTSSPVYQNPHADLHRRGSFWFCRVLAIPRSDPYPGPHGLPGPYPGLIWSGRLVNPAGQEETWFKKKYGSNPLAVNPSG